MAAAVVVCFALPSALAASPANPLTEELGRSESRVWSGEFPLRPGGAVAHYALGERLDRLGYRRVRQKPEAVGEYFWGHEVFWIYRRGHRLNGRDHKPRLFGLVLDNGRVMSAVDAIGETTGFAKLWIEPELLAESVAGDRAQRITVSLSELPERVWRPVLAAEDSRFFDHVGVDGRSLARALLANVKAGKVAQGGSTITQQLIKNRDLTSRRSISRKTSEAIRSLVIEATYDKEIILDSYLDKVYLGNIDGLAIHGFGAAAEAYFDSSAQDLTLAQSALLAAMIQGPNRLNPARHPERVKERRDWVLGRMEELGWATEAEVDRARQAPVRVTSGTLRGPAGAHFLDWLRATVDDVAGERLERGRGVVVESTLDAQLQTWAEDALSSGLNRLDGRSSSTGKLQAALVSVDARSGEVLAYVGGDPRSAAGFDRARQARRQPGSALKPLVLTEAFEACGRQSPLFPSTRIADEAIDIELPSGRWSPTNSDGRFSGVVDLRTALRDSLNVPFVRLARHCGPQAIAGRLRQMGLDLGDEPPLSFVLGSLEVSPLDLAGAYTTLGAAGVYSQPHGIARLERPGGRRLARTKVESGRAVSAATAYLVHDLLRDAVRQGTAEAASFTPNLPAALEGVTAAAKTGTSSERRDAWLAGYANGVVTVVWVGRDDGKPIGLTGAQAAAPIWRDFMEKVVAARPPQPVERPRGIVTKYIDPRTGLRVIKLHPRAQEEIFRRGVLPPRDRLLRRDEATTVLY